jgi:hypothetical protein
MKKTRALSICLAMGAAILLTACIGASSPLNVPFAPLAGGGQLRAGNVFLVVNDARADRSLVGPGAAGKDLFKGSQGGRLDLTTTLPTGQKVARSQLGVQELVFEAVKERLRLLGITAAPNNVNAKARVSINIADFVIDAQGTEALAHVRLEAVIEGPDVRQVTRSWAEADSSRFKLMGDMGGAKSLGEALSLAVNRLNFASLDNF